MEDRAVCSKCRRCGSVRESASRSKRVTELCAADGLLSERACGRDFSVKCGLSKMEIHSTRLWKVERSEVRLTRLAKTFRYISRSAHIPAHQPTSKSPKFCLRHESRNLSNSELEMSELFHSGHVAAPFSPIDWSVGVWGLSNTSRLSGSYQTLTSEVGFRGVGGGWMGVLILKDFTVSEF